MNTTNNKIFDPWEYACEHYCEEMNYMTQEEIDDIHLYDNESELNTYMYQFYERT